MSRLSRYHKYNKKLPGRYLSELSPNSMPLADAKVHLARARLAFQKKLRRRLLLTLMMLRSLLMRPHRV